MLLWDLVWEAAEEVIERVWPWGGDKVQGSGPTMSKRQERKRQRQHEKKMKRKKDKGQH